MRVLAGIAALFALASSMWAQSRPETRAETRGGVEAVRPLIAKIRDGTADVEAVRRVVEALLDSKDGIAAPWWIAEFEAVQKDEKLPASEREALAKLKRACERHDVFSDERATILKII